MQWMQNPKYARKKAKALAKSAATRRKNAHIRSKIVKQLASPLQADKAMRQAMKPTRAERSVADRVRPLANHVMFKVAAERAVQSEDEMNAMILALGLASLNKALAR